MVVTFLQNFFFSSGSCFKVISDSVTDSMIGGGEQLTVWIFATHDIYNVLGQNNIKKELGATTSKAYTY